ncbi:MAG: four-carbon acid sugar kinase family protein [Parvibaculaceae bacterium]
MRELRLIADDLTGALDSGCAFADPDQPVLVGLPRRPLPQASRLAVSTETRNLPEEQAALIVAGMVRRLAPSTPAGALWFKKIDSVMRGHPVAETKAAFHAGDFQRCVFAPAFPGMGRITIDGRQHTIDPGGNAPAAVGPSFAEAFRSQGLCAQIVAFDERGQPRAGATGKVLVIDAESQDMLRQRISAMPARLDGKTLWVGSGGLAATLAGAGPVISHPPIRGLIVGTRHPVTRDQVERILAAGLAVDAAEHAAAPGNGRPLLMAPSLSASSAIDAERRLRASIPHIDIPEPRETSFLVTGGGTLSILLEAVAADFLECHGQVVTGVPVSRVRGGRWNGVTILSKSGGFGAGDLMLKLLRACSGTPRGAPNASAPRPHAP